jgi:protein-glutamine gamma-glutamyltransferase
LRVWLGSGRSPDDLLAELERALARTRRPLQDGVTLVSLEHRFRSSPGAAGYVRSLRLARYGSQSAPPSAAERRALRHELRIGLGLIGRVRALWALPPRLRGTPMRRSRGLK